MAGNPDRVRLSFIESTLSVNGEEDVYTVTLDRKVNTQPEYVLGTFFWHIDGVTINQPLLKATLLTAIKLSPTGAACRR